MKIGDMVIDQDGEAGIVKELGVTGPDTWEIPFDGPYVRVAIDDCPGTFAYAERELRTFDVEGDPPCA